MSLLWACQHQATFQTHYTNPIAVQIVAADKEDESTLFLILGLTNRSTSLLVTQEVMINVSGKTTSMDMQIHLPPEAAVSTRMVVPVDPDLDQLRVIGKVTTMGEEYLAVFDRTIDLVSEDHHH